MRLSGRVRLPGRGDDQAAARAAAAPSVAERILALPEGRWIMVSDSGQVGNPPCPTALRRYAAALARAGVSQERLRRMLVDEPAALVG